MAGGRNSDMGRRGLSKAAAALASLGAMIAAATASGVLIASSSSEADEERAAELTLPKAAQALWSIVF